MSTLQFQELDCGIVHKGQRYAANGAYVCGNVGAVYIGDYGADGRGYWVTRWDGTPVGRARKTSEWWGRYGYKWCSYRVRLKDGSEWHGRHCSDWAQLLKIRRYK